MKIYTKGGDKGSTSLYGGKRVSKDDLRIEAYGTVDELNCLVGMLGTKHFHEETLRLLRDVQNELFNIGSHLATESNSGLVLPDLNKDLVFNLEESIDKMDEHLPPLKTFILPGGSEDNAWVHLTRTVCRRTERRVVALANHEEINGDVVIFLNRLSDFFFVLSRYASYRDGKKDVKWGK